MKYLMIISLSFIITNLVFAGHEKTVNLIRFDGGSAGRTCTKLIQCSGNSICINLK